MKKFKIGLCQMRVTGSKNRDLEKAVQMLESCGRNGVHIAALPEMFNCPYETVKFPEYAENSSNSETLSVISQAAQYNDMYVVAGSIPELDEDKIYNTSFIFNRKGNIVGKHRKIHLFNIDIKNGIRFMESDTLSSGNDITVIDTEYCKIGIAICFDMRFQEMYAEMARKGAKIIFTPGAFNMITGPAHWELLVRARALDNQLFHAAVSPARNKDANYIAYGNTMICDPWGAVLARADEHEQIIYAEIDLDRINDIRRQIPVNKIC